MAKKQKTPEPIQQTLFHQSFAEWLKAVRKEHGIEVSRLIRAADQHGMRAADAAQLTAVLATVDLDATDITPVIVTTASLLERRWANILTLRVESLNKVNGFTGASS